MKTIITLLSIFISLEGLCQVGIQAGLNVSKAASLDYRNDINLGAYYDGYLFEHFSIELNANYSRQGGSYLDQPVRLHYINVSILPKLNYKSVSIYAGQQFGFLINSDDPDFAVVGGLELWQDFIGIGARYNRGIGEYNNRVFQAYVKFNIF